MRARTLLATLALLAMSALTTACQKDVPPEKVKPLPADAAAAPTQPPELLITDLTCGPPPAVDKPTVGNKSGGASHPPARVAPPDWYASLASALRARSAELVACWSGDSDTRTTVGAPLLIWFAIDASGKAQPSTQHLEQDNPFYACLEEVLQASTFPPPQPPGALDVTCAITLGRVEHAK